MNNRTKLLLGLSLSFLTIGCSDKKVKPLSVGTGSQTGVYYPTGQGIAKVVNLDMEKDGFKLDVNTSKGSIYNINAITNGDIEFGIAQSDAQFNAVSGKGAWEGNPQSKIRFMFSLHPESVNLIATVDSGIKTVSDLKGKRVSIGELGSGTRNNAEMVLKNDGIALDAFDVKELSPKEAPKLLQDGKLDAFFYTVGGGAGVITNAAALTKLRLIPIDNVDALMEEYPYFSKTLIKKYESMEGGDVQSFGFTTTFLTSSDVDEEVAYQVTKDVFENLEELKKVHVALKSLTKEGMLKGRTAPFHPGAERYFREVGLLKDAGTSK